MKTYANCNNIVLNSSYNDNCSRKELLEEIETRISG
jgi:hypothetical protein